ncbi:MAG: hypothetical protein GX781_03640 [Clostridiales bacterium]|nr:hypothetical protein [Clostridiales bacterium]
MQFKMKRFAALMMAVMMLLGVTSSLAQEFKPDVRTQVLESGKNISTQMQIEFDQLTLTSILNMFGMGGEDDEAQGQQAVLSSLFDALNKLKMNSLQSLTGAYVTVGTDKGDLMDFQMGSNLQAGEAYFTTSLMPNVKFALNEEMMGAYGTVAKTHNMEMITQWLVPYVEVYEQFSAKQLGEKAIKETGSFEVIDQGSFDSKTSLVFDTHLLADLVEEFLPVIENDQIIKDHLALAETSDMMKSNDLDKGLEEFPEFIADTKNAIAKMRAEPNKVLANVDTYADSQTKGMFVQAELIDEEVPFALLSFSVLPGVDKHDMHFSLLFSQGEPSATADWAALRAGILDGSNPEGVLVEVTGLEEKNQAENKQLVNTRMNLFISGLNIGLAIDNASSLTGKYESESTFAISFLSPQPLITIHATESETEEALPMIALDGYEEVIISENMNEKDTQLLGEKLMVGVEAMLQRLNVVLPEEGPILNMLITSMMTEITDNGEVMPVEPETVTP